MTKSVGPVPFSAQYLICSYVQTDGWTDELIRVELGNLSVPPVNTYHSTPVSSSIDSREKSRFSLLYYSYSKPLRLREVRCFPITPYFSYWHTEGILQRGKSKFYWNCRYFRRFNIMCMIMIKLWQ